MCELPRVFQIQVLVFSLAFRGVDVVFRPSKADYCEMQ